MDICAGVDGSAVGELEGDSVSPSSDQDRPTFSVGF